MNLLDAWPPQGDHKELWPREEMQSVDTQPTTWVTVVQREGHDRSRSRDCALAPAGPSEDGAPSSPHLGSTDLFNDSEFHSGLVDRTYEFFCQARQIDGRERPQIEFAYPFLWYWKAIPDGDRWTYWDQAGTEHDLARVIWNDVGGHRVEVKASALRHYLRCRGLSLKIWFTTDDDEPEVQLAEREDFEYTADWVDATFTVFEWDSPTRGRTPLTSTTLNGSYLIAPLAGEPVWPGHEEPDSYPEFIYGVDPETGKYLTVAPTKDQAGTDGHLQPHSFTQLYFNPSVLERYLNQPGKFQVDASTVRCSNRWYLSIGRDSGGLVHLDLYDLSRMPWQEWAHWRAHNVPPAGGQPDEGKLRREYLNQAASSPDIVRDLRQAREKLDEAFRALTGQPLWKPFEGQTGVEWSALHPPVGSDPAGLRVPVLTLADSLPDSLEPASITSALAEPPRPGTKSIALLRLFVQQLGLDPAPVNKFAELQELRSQVMAHRTGHRAYATLETLTGGAGKTPEQRFRYLCAGLTEAMQVLAEAFERRSAQDDSNESK